MHKLFDLKIQVYYTHFPSIFYRICQIHCWCYSLKVEWFESHFFRQIAIQTFQLYGVWNSNDSVQKVVDLTNPAKNRRKTTIIDLNFQVQKFIDSACRWIWNWPSKLTTRSLIFCEAVKVIQFWPLIFISGHSQSMGNCGSSWWK